MSNLPESTENPIVSLQLSMCTSARDYSLDKHDAWTYGIVVGWNGVTGEVAKIHGWDADDVSRLQRLHEKFVGFGGDNAKIIARGSA